MLTFACVAEIELGNSSRYGPWQSQDMPEIRFVVVEGNADYVFIFVKKKHKARIPHSNVRNR